MRLNGGLLTPDEAVKELERRKNFERYRYYKTPEYFEGLAKSSAHTKLLSCPNKVGKSTFAMMSAYWYAMGTHPFKKIETPNTTWLMGPTIAHVNEVFLDGMREWGLDRFWKSYAEKKGRIIWKNGSITYVKSYDERKNLQGRTIKTAFIDEECPADIWMEIVFRFKAGQQMDIYITATPVEGEEWFSDLCEEAEDCTDGSLYIAPPISIYDAHVDKGGHLSSEDIKRVEVLCRDDIDRRIRMHGERLKRAGAFLQLDDKIHRKDRDSLPGGVIPPDWIRIVGIDPHPRKPTAAVWIALDQQNGDAWVYDARKLTGTAKQQAQECRQINKGRNIFAMYMDPASKEAMSSNMIEMNWNYYDEFVQEYYTVPVITSVRSRDIVLDAVRYRSTYNKERPLSETNRPHLYILRELEDYWRSLKGVRWEEYKDHTLVGMKEQVKKYKDDDLMATGYALVKHPIWVNSVENDALDDNVPNSTADKNNEVYEEMGY